MNKSKNSTVIPIIIPTNLMLKTYNCFLIKTNKQVTLVDAAVDDDDSYLFFLEILKENNLKISDIDQIVLTHNHSDHTGFVRRIRQQTNVDVYAHPLAFLRLTRNQDFLTRRIAFFNKLYNESDTGKRGIKEVKRMEQALIDNQHLRVDLPLLPLVEGDIINGFKVIEVPGHSIDHIALYNENTEELIAGDLILKHAPSNALVEMDENGEMIPSLYLYEQSLKRCEHLKLAVIYPGHGEIINESCDDLFSKRFHSIIRKSKRIKDAIIHQEQTAAQLAKNFYQERYDKIFVLIMSEVIGHLERLVTKNELKKTYQNSVYVYSAIN